MPKKNSNCFYYLPMKLPPYIFWYIRTIQAITLQMPSSFYYILKKCQWHCAFADRSSHVSLFLSVCLCFWHAKYLKWIKISWLSFIWRGLVRDVQKLQKKHFLGISLNMFGLGIWSVITLFTLMFIYCYIRRRPKHPSPVNSNSDIVNCQVYRK